ncbi:MAG: bifunctional ADP-dependent NAD(P)H-hydrate dehydratase/NAD(P)H-hydrate epimerase [Sphingobacteriales bacterium]|nr:bifunctional ADP-dependent NAD(P)H-hydrate dehydratase/NAD(P)H-hydrate epimerase [Sphingobacteriales bacterium]
MLKLLTSSQIHDADKNSIENKFHISVDLMEEAANAFVAAFIAYLPNRNKSISVYCGSGNNGGDGLAISRLLLEEGYKNIKVKVAWFNERCTDDFNINLDRLNETEIPVEIFETIDSDTFEETSEIIIDGLLGSGLNRPLSGDWEKLVKSLNSLNKRIVSIDIPTGLKAEGILSKEDTIIHSELTICFQRPKINFFFPESANALQNFKIVHIGLDENFIQSLDSCWELVEDIDIKQLLKPRKRFTHKGTYGHALIVAGSKETMGAALLTADACLHAGAGLTTAFIPESGLNSLNSRQPEVMAVLRESFNFFDFHSLDKYQSIAIGPGIGKENSTIALLYYFLENFKLPMVLDADALNILSENKSWLKLMPANSILTPHMKEFDRLFGNHSSSWERIETAKKKAAEYQVIILLKNQYSFIVFPDGRVRINSTGNPAMAVGGMGDVLTGIVAAFLAQGYSSEDAATIACYLHGLAGDLLKTKGGMGNIPPRYIIKYLPKLIV